MTALNFNLSLPPSHGAGSEWRFAPLLIGLESLTRINQWHFRRGVVPPLLSSGIVYKEESLGKEDWDDAPTVAGRGWGDCEDLAAYFAAELRETRGIPAECVIKFRFITPQEIKASGYPNIPKTGIYLIHVMVRLPNGQIIDPSKLLGMRGEYH
jgi:hypothetical protein